MTPDLAATPATAVTAATPATAGATASVRVVAVDLGASSGRVFAAELGADHFELTEVGRFPNGAIPVAGTLYWDILRLYGGILDGLREAARTGPVASIGIDSWAVDYGLVDAGGDLLANPVSHRDPRTGPVATEVRAELGAEALYRATGVALHDFNTLFQLVVDGRRGRLSPPTQALLIPDLLSYFLTGVRGTEETNASTTGLLDLQRHWDRGLFTKLGLHPALFSPLRRPGTPAGTVTGSILAELSVAPPVAVTAVASHDTASAVAAVPATDVDFAYISCGTWSLVGLELDRVVVSDASLAAGFSNEAGVDGTVRFLRNVMGLWLYQESVRTWERQGLRIDLAELNEEAAGVAPLRSIMDPDDHRFLLPGAMPDRIASLCREQAQVVPTTPPEVVRCILDSLAFAYRRSIAQAEELSGHAVGVVHVVGGGVNNRLLCQLTADACGLPVIAGPVEAAAIGNAMIQARALGFVEDGLAPLRRRVATHTRLTRYLPDPPNAGRFDALARRTVAGLAG